MKNTGTQSGSKAKLSLLNGFFLTSRSGDAISISNRKACALFAIVALDSNGVVSRERLAGMLWSDSSEERARASLRQSVKQLRAVFEKAGFSGFKSDRQEVFLDKSSLDIDIFEIHEQLSLRNLTELDFSEGRTPDRILYGFESLDRSFAAWLQVFRENWSRKISPLLEEALADDDSEAARVAADALLCVDQSHERAHRVVIEHHARSGNTTAALRQYKSLWDLLDADYDMEPDEETQSLIADVKLGKFDKAGELEQAVPATALLNDSVTPVPERKLPIVEIWNFTQAGLWSLESYFIDGFRQELIASLVRFREWIVVEGNVDDLIEPAGTHNSASDFRLEGSYREEDGEVRLIITLRETLTQRYVWSEQVSVSTESWFSVQQSIVRRVSLALNVYLSAARLAKSSYEQNIAPDMYDLWLQGQALTMEWRFEAHNEAKQIFRKIISEVPGFGRAYSSLVQIENAAPLVQPGTYRSDETNQNNVDLARAAVEIDPLDSRALLCLGWALAINEQFDQAEINLDLARELNNNDHWTLVSVALGMAYCGNHETALALADQVLSLGPTPSKSHWGFISPINFVCGRYRECIEAVDRADDALINLPAWKAAAHTLLGEHDEAGESAKLFVELAQNSCAGDEPLSGDELSRWFLQCFPIREAHTLERLKEGIEGSGIPALA